MNANDPFPIENVDRLLSGFFKSELPDPFPVMKAPASTDLPMPAVAKASAARSRAAMANSRLALAASVALLLGGSWYLSGHVAAPAQRPTVGKGNDSAKIIKEILKAKEESAKP